MAREDRGVSGRKTIGIEGLRQLPSLAELFAEGSRLSLAQRLEKQGWWGRFLNRLAKASQETCGHNPPKCHEREILSKPLKGGLSGKGVKAWVWKGDGPSHNIGEA